MVFVDIERLISDARKTSLSALAANIMLRLELEYDEDELSTELAGKVMLAISKSSRKGFLECCEAIEKRTLNDENEDWVYNEFLVFFTAKAAKIWPDGNTAVRRMVDYRVNRSSEDSRAIEYLNAFSNKVAPINGVIQSALDIGQIRSTFRIHDLFSSIARWCERSHNLNILDQILIASVQIDLNDQLCTDNPVERNAFPASIKAINAHSLHHAKIEFLLLFTAFTLTWIFLAGAIFFGSQQIQDLLGKLAMIGMAIPCAALWGAWKIKPKYIHTRSNQIFKNLTTFRCNVFARTLKLENN